MSLSRLILIALGWKLLTPDQLSGLKTFEKYVIIFPHTTYWDAILLLFYKLAYPEIGHDMYTFMHEGFFNRAPKLFAWLGFISTTRAQKWSESSTSGSSGDLINKGGGGMIQRTVDLMKNKTSYKILLSPEGKLIASPWRSGYFYLAKGLKCTIRVVGADYETHELRFYSFYNILGYMEINNIEPSLKRDMDCIVPLYPSGSFIKVREHDPYLLHFYDPIMLTAWLGPMLMAISAFYLSMYWAGTVNFFSSLASGWYHYSREFNQNARIADVTLCISVYLIYGYLKYLRVGFYLTYLHPIPLILHLVTIYYYYKGCGREGHTPRSHCYSRNHWKFHLWISSLGLFTIWI